MIIEGIDNAAIQGAIRHLLKVNFGNEERELLLIHLIKGVVEADRTKRPVQIVYGNLDQAIGRALRPEERADLGLALVQPCGHKGKLTLVKGNKDADGVNLIYHL